MHEKGLSGAPLQIMRKLLRYALALVLALYALQLALYAGTRLWRDKHYCVHGVKVSLTYPLPAWSLLLPGPELLYNACYLLLGDMLTPNRLTLEYGDWTYSTLTDDAASIPWEELVAEKTEDFLILRDPQGSPIPCIKIPLHEPRISP